MKTKQLKHTTTITLLLSLCVVLLGTGCERDKISIDPNLLIQGKWEIEAKGFGDDLRTCTAYGYTEFYQDSLVRLFDYESDTFSSHFKYYIDNSLLYEIYSDDGSSTVIYEYEFFENNRKLKLYIVSLIGIYNEPSYYKRID